MKFVFFWNCSDLVLKYSRTLAALVNRRDSGGFVSSCESLSFVLPPPEIAVAIPALPKVGGEGAVRAVRHFALGAASCLNDPAGELQIVLR